MNETSPSSSPGNIDRKVPSLFRMMVRLLLSNAPAEILQEANKFRSTVANITKSGK